MKKSILLLALAIGGFCWNTQAQVVPNENFVDQHLKAEKNDFTAEFGLSGGLNNADFKLNEGNAGLLRGRYFIKENLALRLGFSLGLDHSTKNFYNFPSDNDKGSDVENATNFLLNLGIEKHFKGTNRLSPYIGADLLFGVSGQHSVLTNTNGDMYVNDIKVERKGPGTISFGVRALVGADYYFTKHVYLGAEAGLGFLYGVDGKTKTTVTTGNRSQTTTLKSDGSAFTLSPSVITGIRIGFVF